MIFQPPRRGLKPQEKKRYHPKQSSQDQKGDTVNNENLYYFFDTYPDITKYILNFFCKYDDNKFIFRQLSKSFYHLPLYDSLVVDKQSRSFLIKYLKINKIKTLVIYHHNKNLYKIDPKLLSSIHEIIIDVLNEKELYLVLNLFSRFRINILKIMYCTCQYPNEMLLRYNSLIDLDITITSENNQDAVFNLLLLNKKSLERLSVHIYTGKNINETRLQTIIEKDLKLKYIDIRGNLVKYEMIKPCTKHIVDTFRYESIHVKRLQYLVHFSLNNVKNKDLSTIFDNLLVVKMISLYGEICNIDHIDDIENHPHKYILRKYDDEEEMIDYDGTISDVNVKSPYLSSISMHCFTINEFNLVNPMCLFYMTIKDVHFVKPLYLPRLEILYVENRNMNPENFQMSIFKLPKLQDLSLLKCVVRDLFVFNALKSINIQHSIISLDIIHLIKKHKHLKSTLFFFNNWISLNHDKLINYFKLKKIDFHDEKEW